MYLGKARKPMLLIPGLARIFDCIKIKKYIEQIKEPKQRIL